MKVMRNRKQNELKLMRRELGKLLATGQDPSARIRVEHIIREQNILAAYDLLELFCELIVVRLPIIDMQKECPPDLRESIASLIFAAPRCADLPELLQAKQLFQSKYGREFVAAADELRPGCGVNRTIIEKLSVRAPSGESKLALLKEIAAEQNVDWDASASERGAHFTSASAFDEFVEHPPPAPGNGASLDDLPAPPGAVPVPPAAGPPLSGLPGIDDLSARFEVLRQRSQQLG